MLTFFRKYKFFAVVLFVLSAIIITIIYQLMKPKEMLKIYQPADVSEELVDSTLHYVKKYHTIADFSLTNQNGKTITQDDYKDKIYVADFFFTTCQTICPIMTDHMVKIQEALKNDDGVLLLSHTVTPEIDSVAQLKKYALEKGVNDAKWNLVTGDKKEIYDLARKSYLAAKDVPFQENDLVHTENFVLVDKKKRIRGFYDGTDPEAIEKLLADIEILKQED
ncbi:SCO family protein [Aequorivita vladivostokensis]|uniref:Photosynthetic protein synthase II n=1 Tax=Aequorivita vladivostokensis TaxID=171194 RepID=A0ABR5DJ15_9FLAO|nr:SCO family protein [Aequorivita vladivostokensis]KJJ38754.1 photosynthetic protein synthase II [Aequorivita vladivostokensis]MBF30143.1 SCO family protein [Aequorivita sp.]MDX1783475.1 SCO family protein [Aequorivita vladivostokensis]|tara:strand:+ start:349078 stop:349743 length:666 start_codon:yes stop_codon:yes gene_type:complete